MRTPGSRETVFQRQLGIGVLDHVYNAEIARGEGISEAEEGDGDKYELRGGGPAHEAQRR